METKKNLDATKEETIDVETKNLDTTKKETIDSNCRLKRLKRLEKIKNFHSKVETINDEIALINYFKERNDLRYEEDLSKLLEKEDSTNLTEEILSEEEKEIVDLYNEKYEDNIWEIIENLETIEVMVINNTIIKHNPKLTEKLKRTIMQNFKSQLEFILKETQILLNYC